MSISFFWLERGGRWGSSPLTSRAIARSWKLIQKWAFYFFGWRAVADGVRVHRPAGQSSEVECNPILFFWLERGGRWGSAIDQPRSSEVERNPKNEHFIFLAGEGWQMGFKSIDQPGRSSEVECNPKMSISFFWLERGGGWGLSPSTSPGQSSEVECNPKMSILLFWLERGGGWGLSPSTSLANHQKLNLIQNKNFIYLAGEGWQMGLESIYQPWLIIRS